MTKEDEQLYENIKITGRVGNLDTNFLHSYSSAPPSTERESKLLEAFWQLAKARHFWYITSAKESNRFHVIKNFLNETECLDPKKLDFGFGPQASSIVEFIKEKTKDLKYGDNPERELE